MITSAIDLLALVACIVSVIAAVVSVFMARRGSDTQTRGELIELTSLVERLAADTRREKMRRVRAGTATPSPDTVEAPPGFQPMAVDTAETSKAQLRRQVAAMRRQ